MREIAIYCDACQGPKRRVGSPVTVAIDGPDFYSLDLCEDHSETLLSPLRALIGTMGVPTEKLAPKKTGSKPKGAADFTGTLPCPACPQTFTTLASTLAHLQTHHGHKVEGSPSLWFFGEKCPVCGIVPDAGLARGHMQSRHGEIRGGLPGLFEEAKRLGDPHGVVAEQEARRVASLR